MTERFTFYLMPVLSYNHDIYPCVMLFLGALFY